MKIKESLGSRVFNVCNICFMLVLVFITLYPFYNIAITSISSGKAVMQGAVKFWPVGLNFQSYKMIFDDPNILVSYKNTILYTVVGTTVNLAMTMMCAYPLSRRHFYGRNIFTVYIVITMFFSGGMIPTYLVVQNLGMIDTIWALVLPVAISSYNMIIMRTFFTNIPESLFESAHIDGANDLQIFVRLAIPLSLPIIATMVLFYAVGHWNSFFSALLYINTKSKLPVQIILRNLVISGEMANQNESLGASSDFVAIDLTFKYSVIMLTTLPILVVYPFVQKYFVKGVMIGSIKG